MRAADLTTYSSSVAAATAAYLACVSPSVSQSDTTTFTTTPHAMPRAYSLPHYPTTIETNHHPSLGSIVVHTVVHHHHTYSLTAPQLTAGDGSCLKTNAYCICNMKCSASSAVWLTWPISPVQLASMQVNNRGRSHNSKQPPLLAAVAGATAAIAAQRLTLGPHPTHQLQGGIR